MKYRIIGTLLIAVTLFGFHSTFASDNSGISECRTTGDGNAAGKNGKGPDNDSPWDWDENGNHIPCDPHIYTITAVIQSTDSLSRQVAPASGSISGFGINGYSSLSGHYSGEIIDGKGILVINVLSSDSEYATPGSTIIIKTTDTKASFIPEGYTVTFKCRFEYEAIGALENTEEFTPEVRDQASTWEFDYCRQTTPTILPPV